MVCLLPTQNSRRNRRVYYSGLACPSAFAQNLVSGYYDQKICENKYKKQTKYLLMIITCLRQILYKYIKTNELKRKSCYGNFWLTVVNTIIIAFVYLNSLYNLIVISAKRDIDDPMTDNDTLESLMMR